MDPGDIIYLLLIVFGIVASIVSNMNKARKNRPKTEPTTSYEAQEPVYEEMETEVEEVETEVDVRSIFEEIIDQAQQQVAPSPASEAISSVEQLEVKPFSRDSIEDKTEAQLRKEHFKHMDEPDAYDLTLGDAFEWALKGEEGPAIEFDLRQAVIYDAIINRPHAE